MSQVGGWINISLTGCAVIKIVCSSFLRALVSLEEQTGVHTHTQTHTHTERLCVAKQWGWSNSSVYLSTINASLKQIKKISISGYLALYSTTVQGNEDNL